jgi:hypothetical protein
MKYTLRLLRSMPPYAVRARHIFVEDNDDVAHQHVQHYINQRDAYGANFSRLLCNPLIRDRAPLVLMRGHVRPRTIIARWTCVNAAIKPEEQPKEQKLPLNYVARLAHPQ